VLIGVLLSLPLVAPMLMGRPRRDAERLVAAGAGAPVQLGLGARFYAAGWRAARRSGNMDLLVALGTSAALGCRCTRC
jgi:Cu+-exporting ATPase